MFYFCRKEKEKNGFDRLGYNSIFIDGRYSEHPKEADLLWDLALHQCRLVHILPHEGVVCIQPALLCILLSFDLGNN